MNTQEIFPGWATQQQLQIGYQKMNNPIARA